MADPKDRFSQSEAYSLNSEFARERGRARYPNFVDLPTKAHVRSPQVDRTLQFKAPTAADSNKSLRATQRQTVKKHSGQGQPTRRKDYFWLYALRLLILGVGISAIAGTVLSALDPTTRVTSKQVQMMNMQVIPQEPANGAVASDAVASAEVPADPLKLNQEIVPLKTFVQQLAAKNTKLLPGIFFVDLDNGAFLNVNGDLTFSAASMIKFPILVALLQDVDAGKIRLDEKLTLKKELIGGGSGDMQYRTPGTQFTTLETATKMIIISDNTATNMLIERLGGVKALNQRFQSWGLTVTEIRNPLPDLAGTNTTSPRDLAHLMGLVQHGDLISMKSRDRLLEIMRRTKTATLLPKGLGPGATIAHKTGDIGSLVGDVGLVDMPSGKRYIAVAMVKRPYNDGQAKELIRQISRAAYQQFNQPAINDVMPTAPFITKTLVQTSGRVGEQRSR